MGLDKYNLSDDIQNVLTDTTEKTIKMLNDKDRVTNKNILTSLKYTNFKPSIREMASGRSKSKRGKLNADVEKISHTSFISDFDLEIQGLKIIIQSNIIDLCTRSQDLLGLKVSGHTNNLTEASKLFEELYKRSENLYKQHYQNALDKIIIN